MFRRLFLDHPASVGESYAEHFGVASRFGATLVAGGIGCMIHAILPFAFKTRGSDTVMALHRDLVAKRNAHRAAHLEMTTVEYVI
jgi:Family of unknown function (DUF6356)